MKKFFKSIYLKILTVYLVYGFFGKLLLFKGILPEASIFSKTALFVYYGAFSVIFLYLFSHEGLFKFAKAIEKKESKKEKKLIKEYIHFGKIAAVFIIGLLVGPVFAALTARILIHRSSYKYLIVVLSSIISTALWLAFFRGAFKQIF